MISDCIKPLRHLHVGPGKAPARTFKFNDSSTVIYPKLPDGKSIKVTIIKRALTSSQGVTFHVCRNAGKWSCRIDYPFKRETTRVTRSKFVGELRRMGAGDYIDLLFERA